MKKLSLILGLALGSSLMAADPAQLELAHKVVKAGQFDRMFEQMAPQMQQMVAQAMSHPMTPDSPAEKDAEIKAQAEVASLAADSTKTMLQNLDTVYADTYTDAELKAMLVFFESPEGKSMMEKQPQIMQHLRPMVQALQKDLMPKIQGIVEKAKASVAAVNPPTATPPTATTPAGPPPPMPSPAATATTPH